jgi:AraC family transcriptional regulator
MSSLSDCGTAFVFMTDKVGNSLGIAALSELISIAAATLDKDRATARACLQRAEELLRVPGAVDPTGAATWIRGGLSPWQQRSVIAYLAANISSPIRVIDLARVARLSRGHFFRAFRESFGEPPLAHVARQRIQRAQSLMLNSAAPLSQIALDCGMCDQAHFTRVFRRIVGINPGIWRRRFGTGDANADLKGSPRTAGTHLTSIQYGSRPVQA